MVLYKDNNFFARQSNQIKRILHADITNFLKQHLINKLKSQVDENKDRFPEKKQSTIKQYKLKGYNTTDWLIRTGKSTKLEVTKFSGGFRIFPAGKDTLKYVKKAADWFTISNQTAQQIIDKIKRELR
ncbi:MAG: hypothetical protein KatS3mg036_0493 [Ignavibacterium sp.]|uniref:hypothetical protein n=1 Tax=Ignavibacterium sp. TaxID=2651167 RepID=UPI0021DC7F41|nr:hypothetical protein [Ignavibacterium sp.]BDQ01939.1 MAG: hypothetical protein KatS3mg037_0514 [Ignavibacterium sp.]GIV45675.1 MAG: hypothetical protein KatS3mg036_0493 [Ignavibacterium sp.]